MKLKLTHSGYDVVVAGDGEQDLQVLEEDNFDLILLDLVMPKMDGFELMREIRALDRTLVDIVIITGHSNIDNTITALREGAYDYLQKPININELAIIIDRVS